MTRDSLPGDATRDGVEEFTRSLAAERISQLNRFADGAWARARRRGHRFHDEINRNQIQRDVVVANVESGKQSGPLQQMVDQIIYTGRTLRFRWCASRRTQPDGR